MPCASLYFQVLAQGILFCYHIPHTEVFFGMKKLIALILTLVLLCGAAFAEAPAAGSIEAALQQAMDVLLSGDTQACLNRMNMEMKANAVEVLTQIGALGDVESVVLNATAEQGGCYAGEFSVVHAGVPYTYALVLDREGKIGAVSIDVNAAPTKTELDENIDFQARVEEIMQLLVSGAYDSVLARLNEGVSAGVTAGQLEELMKAYGDVEMYSIIYLMQSQGYHQAVVEFRGVNGIGQWQLTLDGEGNVAGLYLADKMPERETMAEADADAARERGKALLNLLLEGKYADFRAAMMEEMADQLTEDVLAGAVGSLGAYTALTMHDMWHQDGVTGVEMLVDHAQQEMLYSLIVDGEGTLVGFGYYPVVRPAK